MATFTCQGCSMLCTGPGYQEGTEFCEECALENEIERLRGENHLLRAELGAVTLQRDEALRTARARQGDVDWLMAVAIPQADRLAEVIGKAVTAGELTTKSPLALACVNYCECVRLHTDETKEAFAAITGERPWLRDSQLSTLNSQPT